MNFDKHLFRCSALGNIVTKSGKITEGAQTHLKEVFIGELYGVKKEAYGKALEKGVATEQDGLKMLNDTLYPGRFVAKVQNGFENDFIKGTPDAIMDGIVYDIKNAYDRFTFGKAELSHLYEWQIKGYCYLTGHTSGRIFYCLNNMPDHMISEEERSMFYKLRKWVTMDDPDYLKACDELRAAHSYDMIPIAERFKLFPVEFTTEDKERIEAAVAQARKHLNGLWKEHQEEITGNLELMVGARNQEAA